MKMTTKRITTLAMLSALAFLVMAISRLLPSMVLFLKYDPKDIIITIGGFLFGPLSALAITVVVAFAEMITVSDTGLIGLVMNIISGCAFACTASFIYKKKRNLVGAVVGLAAAWLLTTAVMTLWNYLITPLYMKVPREDIVGMLFPVFIPFNLIKGGLNGAFTMILYKPIKTALQASHIMPPPEQPGGRGRISAGVIIASSFVIATCVLWILVLQGVL